MRRNLYAGLLALTMFYAAGCSLGSTGNLPDATGILEAEELPVATEVGGVVQTVHVEDGSVVRKNQELARIDDRSYQLAVREAEAVLMQATARLEEAKAGTRNQTLRKGAAAVQQAAANVSQAEARARQAQSNLSRLEDQLEQVNSQLQGAKQTLAYQQERLAETEKLFASGAVSRRDRETQAEAVNQAQTQVNQLTAQLAATRSQYASGKGEQEAALAQIETSKAQVNSARADLDLLEEGSTDFNLKALLGAELQARAKLDQARLQLEKTRILAAEDGLVLRTSVTTGELAKAGATLFTMMKKDQLKMKVYLPEAELGKVHTGQKVTVAVDAYPDQTFIGVIRSIADQAEFTPKNIQTKDERTKMVFAIRIDMETGLDQLKPGMPADVWFESQVKAK